MSEESYDELDDVERAVPEVTAAHQAWSIAAHRVLEGGDAVQLAALREMVERMRNDVESVGRQIEAGKEEGETAEGAEPWG